jgi:hypothetical protein
MKVCYAFPTACPIPQARACLEAWRDMGYGTAIIVLDQDERPKLPADIVLVQAEYPGFAKSVNRIARWVLHERPECQIIVTAGDDCYPDQTKRANEIAEEFIEHFHGTLGVMQPSGDEWHHTHDGKGYIQDTCAWSPWLGREWCERSYMGRGPLHEGFYHYWNDYNLLKVAEWLGVFWRRADIIQPDYNWKRDRYHLGRPKYLYEAKKRTGADKALAQRLDAEGYPGCELLPL